MILKKLESRFANRKFRSIAYVIICLAFAAFGLIFSVTSLEKSVATSNDRLRGLVAMNATAVDIYFQMFEKALSALAIELAALPPGQDAHPNLVRFKNRYRELEIVVMTDLEGNIFRSTLGPSDGSIPPIFVGDDPGFLESRARLLEGATMTIGRVLKGPVTKKLFTPLRFGVRNPAGKLSYILTAGVTLSRSLEFWTQAPVPKVTALGMIRDDFYLIARQPALRAGQEAQFFAPTEGVVAAYLKQNPTAKSGLTTGYSSVTLTNTTAVLHRLEHYPIYVFGALPASVSVYEWWDDTWPIFALVLLLFVGTVGTIHWSGRKSEAWLEARRAHIDSLESMTLSLSNANRQLEDRNAEMESFVYSISHDLRAPIRAIDNYAAILHEEIVAKNHEEVLTLLDVIRTSARRMTSLLADLLELARSSSHEMQVLEIDVQAKVASVISESNFAIPPASFEVNALPPQLGDPVLMRQVWINLISNAAKFSARTLAPKIRIGFENQEYFVEDNGSGFDPAYKDKLFKLFSRLHTDAEFSGTGVGLAIVKRIVARHGGHIRAESNPGVSTRFSFSIGPTFMGKSQ